MQDDRWWTWRKVLMSCWISLACESRIMWAGINTVIHISEVAFIRSWQVHIKGLPVTLHSSDFPQEIKKTVFEAWIKTFFSSLFKHERKSQGSKNKQSSKVLRSWRWACFFSCQSVPEWEEDRRINEEDDRGRKGEEREEEEEDERSIDEGFMGMTPLLQAHHAMERMEEFVHKVMNTHTHTHTGACVLGYIELVSCVPASYTMVLVNAQFWLAGGQGQTIDSAFRSSLNLIK